MLCCHFYNIMILVLPVLKLVGRNTTPVQGDPGAYRSDGPWAGPGAGRGPRTVPSSASRHKVSPKIYIAFCPLLLRLVWIICIYDSMNRFSYGFLSSNVYVGRYLYMT